MKEEAIAVNQNDDAPNADPFHLKILSLARVLNDKVGILGCCDKING
jgi:hypothetical protein